MAFLECNFFSETLGLSVNANVILPQTTVRQIGLVGSSVQDLPPVLYLLHGLSDDHTIWMRRTSIERYATQYGFAVIMPAVNRSFYTNTRTGYRYFDFVADELPALCQRFFRISSRREDSFVAGLSMGGYGTMKLALTYPDRWFAAASLSGALDVHAAMQRRLGLLKEEVESNFGSVENIPGSSNDLFQLLRVASSSATQLPHLYACCGTEDFLYQDNLAFVKACNDLKVPLAYQEAEGQAHEWSYWDEAIQDVLKWIHALRSSATN